jgi:hypothetical protein
MSQSPKTPTSRFYVIDGQVVDNYHQVECIKLAATREKPPRDLTCKLFYDEEAANAFALGSPLPESRKTRRFYAVMDKCNHKFRSEEEETSWLYYDDWQCVLDKVLKGNATDRYRYKRFDSEDDAVSALRKWVGIPDKVYEPLNCDGSKFSPLTEISHRRPSSGKPHIESCV